LATEDAPVLERQDRMHRVSGEWIQSIPTVSSILFVISNSVFSIYRFAENSQKE
jgi:hypothetical protein